MVTRCPTTLPVATPTRAARCRPSWCRCCWRACWRGWPTTSSSTRRTPSASSTSKTTTRTILLGVPASLPWSPSRTLCTAAPGPSPSPLGRPVRDRSMPNQKNLQRFWTWTSKNCSRCGDWNPGLRPATNQSRTK
ncbi:mucin-2-like [Nerophis ophidion]|uniref:mucin-2-like n=1 Tax=Nerophis ophidion TaxID=159077 RepID=UPI002ADF0814|nr:mucin-2-like [Nerophis ophidion]